TPAYMAPEQASRREIGPETDVYALGGHALSIADGAPAPGREEPRRNDLPADQPGPAPAAPPGAEPLPRPRDGVPEVPREGAAQTLQERRGPGRRPPPVPPGRTRPRPPVRAAGARPAVGAAFAGPGRDDGGGRASAGGLRGRAERGDRAAPEGTGPVARVG